MGARLFIGNLSVDTIEADLRAAFASRGLDPVDVRMVKDPETRKPRGFAFAELTTQTLLLQAIERMDRYELKGRAISVREVNDRAPFRRPRRPGGLTVPASHLVPKQVLLVEDDPDIRQATSMALVESGYSVVEASNGRDALDQLLGGSCRPTTILLDMTMPIMDGHGFMTELHKLPGLASVGVILTSAQIDLPEVAAALGASGHLVKPIGFDQLTQMVARLDQRVSDDVTSAAIAGAPPGSRLTRPEPPKGAQSHAPRQPPPGLGKHLSVGLRARGRPGRNGDLCPPSWPPVANRGDRVRADHPDDIQHLGGLSQTVLAPRVRGPSGPALLAPGFRGRRLSELLACLGRGPPSPSRASGQRPRSL